MKALRKTRGDAGFTLIELMIVVLIIGILVAIAIPVFQSVQNNARRRTCQANIRTLNGAIQSFAGDNEGTYPTALGDLDPNYVRVVPACPGNGTTTGTYSLSGAGAAMEVVCSLAAAPDNHAI